MQGAAEAAASDRPSGPAQAPLPSGGASAQFAAATLTDLLSTQEGDATSPFAKVAADLIKQADTDGDGALSADEIKAATGGDSTASIDEANGLSAAMAKLDANGDGTLNADELSAGLETRRAEGGHHGHGHAHGASSSSDVAAKVISQADSNGDGVLGLDEVQGALGSDAAGSAQTLTGAMSAMDTNGDGKLSAAELSAAMDAFHTAEGSDDTSSTHPSVMA